MTKLFPLLLICLQIGAGVACFIGRDWRRGVYWIAASVLNVVVTF